MMLRARDLSVGYGAAVIGTGIGLDVQAGEILCLLGPNGFGPVTGARGHGPVGRQAAYGAGPR